jgi:hypothetical protein
MGDGGIDREDVHAAVNARRELGEDLEPQVVDAFLDRIGHAIDARVDARLAHERPREPARRGGGVVLGLGSIGMGIGATGAATGMGGESGVVVAIAAWLAIAAVNVAHGLRR